MLGVQLLRGPARSEVLPPPQENTVAAAVPWLYYCGSANSGHSKDIGRTGMRRGLLEEAAPLGWIPSSRVTGRVPQSAEQKVFPMTASKYVVVGAGLAGTPTAWQLASQGHEVTILERSTPANHAGSSHGSARIFRYAYPEDFYTRLVVKSKAAWDELARLSGRRLIGPTGAVDYGSTRQPERVWLRFWRRTMSSMSCCLLRKPAPVGLRSRSTPTCCGIPEPESSTPKQR